MVHKNNVGRHRHGTQAELRARWNANGGRLEGFSENALGHIVSNTRARGAVATGHVRPESMETFRSGDFNIPDGFQLTYNPAGTVRWRLYGADGRALNINSKTKINERTGVSVDYAGLMQLYGERRSGQGGSGSSGQGGSGSSDPANDPALMASIANFQAPEPPTSAILQAVQQSEDMVSRLRPRRGNRSVSSSSLASSASSSDENFLDRYARLEGLNQEDARQAIKRYKATLSEDELRQNLASSQAVASASSGDEQAVVNAVAGATLPLAVSQVTNRRPFQHQYEHRDENGNQVPGIGWHAIIPEEGGDVRYYPPMIGDKWEEMDIEDSPGRLGYWTSFAGAMNHIQDTRGFYADRNIMADSNFSHSINRLNALPHRRPEADPDPNDLGDVLTRRGMERAYHGFSPNMTPGQMHDYGGTMASNDPRIRAVLNERPDRLAGPAALRNTQSGGRMTGTLGPGYANMLNRLPTDVLTRILRDYQYPERRSGRKRD